jgi:hypothetical protein
MASIKPNEELICVEESLKLLAAETWIPVYDFRFDQF